MARRTAIVRRIEPFPTGWQMEEKKPIVGHGDVALSSLGKKDASTTNSHPMATA